MKQFSFQARFPAQSWPTSEKCDIKDKMYYLLYEAEEGTAVSPWRTWPALP